MFCLFSSCSIVHEHGEVDLLCLNCGMYVVCNFNQPHLTGFDGGDANNSTARLQTSLNYFSVLRSKSFLRPNQLRNQCFCKRHICACYTRLRPFLNDSHGSEAGCFLSVQFVLPRALRDLLLVFVSNIYMSFVSRTRPTCAVFSSCAINSFFP